jgi:hypothetical protein
LNGRIKIAILSLVALGIILVPTIAVAAQSSSSAGPQKIYPKGTICGDAQIGPYSTAVFNGRSDYQKFYSLYTINGMVLSGGNTGTVTSTSGSLSVYNHKGGTLLLYATYTKMSGSYKISGSTMYLTSFTAKKIVVSFNSIKDHGNDHMVQAGTYKNAHIPDVQLPCTTQDTNQ